MFFSTKIFVIGGPWNKIFGEGTLRPNRLHYKYLDMKKCEHHSNIRFPENICKIGLNRSPSRAQLHIRLITVETNDAPLI